mgnify:CR=1 FL=1
MINNNKIWVSNYIISLLFSFNIFFWGIAYNFIQLRFLIFFLLIPLLINLNKKIFFKILKYALISAVVFLHLFLQSNVFVNASLFFIFGFFQMNYLLTER